MEKIILNMSKAQAYKHILENYNIPFRLRNYVKWQLNYDGKFEYIDKIFIVKSKEKQNETNI